MKPHPGTGQHHDTRPRVPACTRAIAGVRPSARRPHIVPALFREVLDLPRTPRGGLNWRNAS